MEWLQLNYVEMDLMNRRRLISAYRNRDFQSSFQAKSGSLEWKSGHRDSLWWIVLWHCRINKIFLLLRCVYINWKFPQQLASHFPFPFLYNENLCLQSCPATLMRHPSMGKGKQKASPSPSSSSAEDDSILDQSRSVKMSKRVRLSSPAWVKQTALAKVASKSKSGSSSKGLAGFAALVGNANLSAARAETSRGLHSSSSTRSRGGASARSKTGKTVSISISYVYKNIISFSMLGRHVYCRHDRLSGGWCYGGMSYILLWDHPNAFKLSRTVQRNWMTLRLFILFIVFSQMSIYLPWASLEWSNLAFVLWRTLDSNSFPLTPTQSLMTSSAFSFPNSLTGYPNPNQVMRPPPLGLFVWSLPIRASPLLCIQITSLSQLVSI